MNNARVTRLWQDIGGVDELFLDELAMDYAFESIKSKRRVKYGAIIASVATLSAAAALVALKPKFITGLLKAPQYAPLP